MTLDVTGIWGPLRLSSGTELETKTELLGRGPDLGITQKEKEEVDSLIHVKTPLVLGFSFPRSTLSHLANTLL